MARLRVLGGLEVEGVPFRRTKALLLLAYLTLEGPKQRGHLAELFWRTGNRMKSLSMALTLLRQGAGEVIGVEANHVKAVVPSDVQDLLDALDKQHWERATQLYTGAFLEGVVLRGWGSELEEWVYQTREYLAERVQFALLSLAEAAAESRDFRVAKGFAERAYKLPGLAGTEAAHLERLYTLLCAGGSLLAPEVRKEAESYGIALHLSTEKARTTLGHQRTPVPALPMRGTSFVGRDVELAELATLLGQPNVSLLTLLGTAGVGKTRLATQLAREQGIGAFKDGVHLVPLEVVKDASLVPASLLGYFGLAQQGNVASIDQLGAFLADKRMLLILDNFEHVGEAATFLSPLLRGCPKLKLLVTSRETLRLEEEYVYLLEGLSPTNTADASLSDAVQLFKERARQVQPHFTLEGTLADVLRICQLVDALPLGIELAASWVRLMSCEEIASEIERGLEVLRSTARNVPERHRSLRAAFEHSWRLLSAREQEVLRKLSVFRGGFRREAASEVVGATIPLLASLVDKTLLRVRPTGRYDFHPLLRRFAREKLSEHRLHMAEVEKAHARYFSGLLRQNRSSIPRARQNEVTDTLAEELGNLDLMWRYLGEHRWTEAIAQLATPTFLLHYNLGRLEEGAKLFGEVRAALDATKSDHLLALGSLCVREAGYLKYLASFRASVLIAEEGLEHLRRSPHPDAKGRMTVGLNEAGVSSYHLGRFRQAEAFYRQAVELAKSQNDLSSATIFESNLANLMWHLGDFEGSQPIKLRLIEQYKNTEDWERLISELCALATVKWSMKAYGEAKAFLEQAVALVEQHRIRSPPLLCDLTAGLGVVHGSLGNYDRARGFHETSLRLAEETGSPLYVSSAASDCALTFIAMGDYKEADHYLKTCIGILWAGSERGRLLFVLIGWAKSELGKGNPEKATELLGFVLAQPELTPKDQRLAQDTVGLVGKLLSEKEVVNLLARGGGLSLEQVVAAIGVVNSPVSSTLS